MGFLNSAYLDSDYSVVETRILFELKIRNQCKQCEINKALGIDKSYLSRIIKRFFDKGLIEKEKSGVNKRVIYLALTKKGQEETEKMIQLTNNQIHQQIKNLTSDDCNQLCDAINTIITILDKVNNQDY